MFESSVLCDTRVTYRCARRTRTAKKRKGTLGRWSSLDTAHCCTMHTMRAAFNTFAVLCCVLVETADMSYQGMDYDSQDD